MTLRIVRDLASLLSSAMRSHAQLAAENLFLRKQLAMYQERRVKPRRADNATRIVLVALSRFLEWRQLLTIVKPKTLIGWHRKGFRLFWRWKSRTPGRPPIPADVQQLIATMATGNRTWGEERIASELLVKLGIRVSPRTVRRYMPSRPPRARQGKDTQTWSRFVRNHAQAVLASDFFVVVTATFRVMYVFIVLEVGCGPQKNVGRLQFGAQFHGLRDSDAARGPDDHHSAGASRSRSATFHGFGQVIAGLRWFGDCECPGGDKSGPSWRGFGLA